MYGPKPAVGQSDRLGGDKSVAVLGGHLSLHGKKLVSWTRLAVTAHPGDSQITVFNDIDWEVGDQIVIATTANYAKQGDSTTALNTNEVKTISAINGRTIQFTTPLAAEHLSMEYDLHFGGLILKKQAEVGLLSTRNIVIQGDYSSTQTGFGGHVMLLSGARAYVSGVQLYQAGK